MVQPFPDGRERHLADEERCVDLAALQCVKRLEIDQGLSLVLELGLVPARAFFRLPP